MIPDHDRVREALARIVRPATMERLVDPILTDMRLEYQAARRSGHRWASRWRLLTGVVGLIKALAVYACVPREWPADDRRAVARTIGYATAMTGAGMLMLIMPPLSRWPDRIRRCAFHARLLYAAAGLSCRAPDRASVRRLVRVARRSLLSAIRRGGFDSGRRLLGGVVGRARMGRAALEPGIPGGRDAETCDCERREREPGSAGGYAESPITRGANELTLGELRRRIQSEREWGRDSTANAMSYHSRWALAAAPPVVVMWALLLLGRGARQRWLLALAAFATCAGYAGLMTAGRFAVFRGMLPPMAGAWIANLAFMAITIRLAATTDRAASDDRERRTKNVERRT